MAGRDTDSISKCGLKHGDIIHISNQGTVMTQLPQKKEMKTEEVIKKEKEEKEKDAPLKDSHGRVIKTLEKVDDGIAKDSRGQVIKEAKKEEK